MLAKKPPIDLTKFPLLKGLEGRAARWYLYGDRPVKVLHTSKELSYGTVLVTPSELLLALGRLVINSINSTLRLN